MLSSHSTLHLLTFNLLAPPYKRLNTPQEREAFYPDLYTPRLNALLSLLLSLTPSPDVICLQEVWFHPAFQQLFMTRLSPHFHIFLAQRPDKPDGLALLVRRHSPAFHSHQHPKHVATVRLAASDRVALAVRLTLQCGRKILVVNTHLTFPHCRELRRLRGTQAEKLLELVDKEALGTDVLLMGDFNGEPDSGVCKRILAAGFRNCWQQVKPAKDEVKTHHNHKGEVVFVDHVFLKRRTRRDLHKYKPLTPTKVRLYPEEDSLSRWPSTWTISDHRPVGITLVCEQPLPLHQTHHTP